MLAPGSMMGGMLTGFDLRVCMYGRSAGCREFRRLFGADQGANRAVIDAIGSRAIAAGV
jgi:hypothetical protein